MKVDKEEEVSKMLQEAKIFISMFDEIVSNTNEKDATVHRENLKNSV